MLPMRNNKFNYSDKLPLRIIYKNSSQLNVHTTHPITDNNGQFTIFQQMESVLQSVLSMSLNDQDFDDAISRIVLDDPSPLDTSHQNYQSYGTTVQDPPCHLFPITTNDHISSTLSAAASEHPPLDTGALLSQDQKDDYALLWQLDQQLDVHMKDILMALDKLASPEQSVESDILLDLVNKKQWLKGTIDRLQAFATTDQVGQLLKDAMLCRFQEFVAAVDCYISILKDRTEETPQEEGGREYCTGMRLITSIGQRP
jgi:hypothetical protein